MTGLLHHPMALQSNSFLSLSLSMHFWRQAQLESKFSARDHFGQLASTTAQKVIAHPAAILISQLAICDHTAVLFKPRLHHEYVGVLEYIFFTFTNF